MERPAEAKNHCGQIHAAAVQARLDATRRAHADLGLTVCVDRVVHAGRLLVERLAAGNKALLCGNGGSAADCQHMAAELVCGMTRGVRRRALPAIALATDSSILTAWSNDVGFDGVFARQLAALGAPGDVLIAISTSGSSRNIGMAIAEARRRSVATIGLFGAGARLASCVDAAIVVPSTNTQIAQELMLTVEHVLCEIVEHALVPASSEGSEAA